MQRASLAPSHFPTHADHSSCAIFPSSHIRKWVYHPRLSWHLYWQYTLANANQGSVLQREAWEAAPISCNAAIELFGADNAHPMSQVTPQIPHLPPATTLTVLYMLQLTIPAALITSNLTLERPAPVSMPADQDVDSPCVNRTCVAVDAAGNTSCGHMLAVGMSSARQCTCTCNHVWPSNGWQHRCSLHAAAVWCEDAAHGGYSILSPAGR